MKISKIFKCGLFLMTILIVSYGLSLQAQEIPTLEGTSWDISVVSVVTFQTTSATLTFSGGQVAINNWIFDLNPGTYVETPQRQIISFNAALEKPGVLQTQIFEIQGAAMGENIVIGLLHNVTTQMYYIFLGEPLPVVQ